MCLFDFLKSKVYQSLAKIAALREMIKIVINIKTSNIRPSKVTCNLVLDRIYDNVFSKIFREFYCSM